MRPFIIFFCVASATALAQQPAVFQSETRVVLVDAVVTDKKGEHLGDLSAKDFRIWEDNREQTIRSFSATADPSPAEPRRLVLFFDDAGLSAADQVAVRQAAAGFIDGDAGPGAMMAVVNFDGGFRVAQSFTADGARLKEAVRGVAFGTKQVEDGTSSVDRAQAAASANFNVRGLTEAVGNLARNLNAVPGRKMVVLFTTGASFSGVQESDIAELVEICNRSNVALYPVALQTVSAPPANGLGCGQRQATRFPGGQQQDASGCAAQDNSAVPSALGSGTGGFLVRSNDVLGQLQRIGAEQKQSYVVGYVPPDSKEGVCHKLRVKVERSGVTVRARSGYCTAKPQDLLAKSRVEQDLEKHAATQTGTASAAAMEAPFFYTSTGVARVHLAMEIATGALQFENQKGKLHAEMNILGIAADADGTVAARFSDIVRRSFNTKQELDQWKQMPLHYEKEFRIVPGQYTLTVVFSSGGANFGRAEAPLTIDPYERGQMAISGLALSKEVKPAADLGLEASLIDEGTPLVAGILQVIPTGSNLLRASAPAFCYFEVYTPGATEPATVALRILDARTGAQKWDGGRAKIEPPAPGKFTIPVGLSVPISSLAAGSYTLELSAADDAGKTAKRTLDFVVQ